MTLRILMVEDSADDAEIVLRELTRAGFEVSSLRVESEEELEAALDREEWDLVLSDHSLPQFSGRKALSIVRARDQDTPFIFVSGTMSEDAAVSAMKAGAQDYVVKDRLKRLVPAVERELREAAAHREQRRIREERSEIEAQLRQAQKLESIGHLTGGLAHDFNNLLAVIVGNLDILQDSMPVTAQMQRELIDTAMTAALHGGELTRQLLAFARRQPLNTAAFDLNALVSQTAVLLRRTLGEVVEIEVHLAADLWTAEADPVQVESALTNLAINARDAMSGGGRLVIETSNGELDAGYAAENPDTQPGAYVVLAVSDTGSGIPPEILARVCEPFFTTKPAGKGSGLGLSMVYGFAKQSGGHFKIYSEVGQGTTARLYLPRATDRPLVEEAPGGFAALAAPPGVTVLVVEDNDDVRRLVVRQLKDFGYQVKEARSAAAALRLLEEVSGIGLLFSDVMMPGGMLGTELAREARSRWPGMKVLLTTGFSEVMLQGKLDDGVPVITKPYRSRALAARIRDVLAGGA